MPKSQRLNSMRLALRVQLSSPPGTGKSRMPLPAGIACPELLGAGGAGLLLLDEELGELEPGLLLAGGGAPEEPTEPSCAADPELLGTATEPEPVRGFAKSLFKLFQTTILRVGLFLQ